jgi:hypothetical protein
VWSVAALLEPARLYRWRTRVKLRPPQIASSRRIYSVIKRDAAPSQICTSKSQISEKNSYSSNLLPLKSWYLTTCLFSKRPLTVVDMHCLCLTPLSSLRRGLDPEVGSERKSTSREFCSYLIRDSSELPRPIKAEEAARHYERGGQ